MGLGGGWKPGGIYGVTHQYMMLRVAERFCRAPEWALFELEPPLSTLLIGYEVLRQHEEAERFDSIVRIVAAALGAKGGGRA